MDNYKDKNWKVLKYPFFNLLTDRFKVENVLKHIKSDEIFKALYLQEPIKK